MAASRISLFSQFSNYWSVFGISIRCHVCHATTSGIQKKREQKNPQKMKRKINFPLFTYFNHSFHLFAYLICFDKYAFTCFQTLTKFYSVCLTGFVAIYTIPMQKNIHSFIRIALKHFVTCNHLSKSFCPFCL